MKILHSWIQEFVRTRFSPREIQDALTMAGVEVSACRYLGEGMENVVTGKILDLAPTRARTSFPSAASPTGRRNIPSSAARGT